MTPADRTLAHRAGLAGIIAFVTMPSMGVTPDVARAHNPDAVADWLLVYCPRPFPGPVDLSLLPRGADVYRVACADCHGRYDASLTAPRLVSFPDWEGDVGTDPARARLLTPQVAAAVTAVFGDLIAVRTGAT